MQLVFIPNSMVDCWISQVVLGSYTSSSSSSCSLNWNLELCGDQQLYYSWVSYLVIFVLILCLLHFVLFLPAFFVGVVSSGI